MAAQSSGLTCYAGQGQGTTVVPDDGGITNITETMSESVIVQVT